MLHALKPSQSQASAEKESSELTRKVNEISTLEKEIVDLKGSKTILEKKIEETEVAKSKEVLDTTSAAKQKKRWSTRRTWTLRDQQKTLHSATARRNGQGAHSRIRSEISTVSRGPRNTYS
jgi:hypothetical protein